MAHQVRGVVAKGQAAGDGRDDRRARSRARRGARAGAGVRRVPHRPALPRGRHQRRLPVPARPRGRRAWSRRSAPTSPSVAPGDFVVLNWRAVCGECRSCRRGRPWYCFSTHNAHAEDDARRRHRALARARHRRVRGEDARRRGPGTKVDPAAKPEAAGPARLRRDGRPRRRDATPARSAAATPSRCSAAAASATPRSPARRLAGARTIIAVDLDAEKLEWAKEFGATHTVDASKDDPVEAIQALTDGNGADVCIEAVGRPEVLRAGVLRPRPRRHRRAGRRADARHDASTSR